MKSTRAALYAAVLAALVLPVYVLDLGEWPLESNDETRFPVMARDILASGHWLLPEIASTPMLNKPPLFAWLIAIASLPGGAVTAKSAALPSLVTGLVLALVTGWLGTRLFGGRAGLTAGFVSVTTAGLFSLSHVPLPDTALTLAITAAICALALAEFEGRPRALIAFYGATGLGFLIKGPVGLIPIAVALVFELIAHGWRGARRLLSWPGFLLLALLIAPWPILAVRSGGSTFVDKVLLKDMHDTYFGRGGKGWSRLTEPVVLTVTNLLPWAVLVPLIIWSAARESDGRHAQRMRLLWLWAAIAFVLIALDERQRLRYYLPLVPPVAVLVAAWYDRLPVRRGLTVLSAVSAVLVVVGLAVAGRYEISSRHRNTTIDDLVREVKSAPAPMFALDSPDILFDFYLEQPVVPLRYYRQFAEVPGPAYLVTSERAAAEANASADRLAVARVSGRSLVLLRK